ncbi:uncharacterized protein ACHE_20229A [Aspergillus chevalieri]|uniref:Uncharacterized protein n=1 Tax=Aspergillus chevalieri TaxID=182096 RepID=A0A7R7ZKW8_ASPCH|nr:uncharacterized protein ACHE_20229A [Aspergillus chevalieri]BCR84771.1 hypothetical protein ACHE_20229A [Aspergillus chevalieri]
MLVPFLSFAALAQASALFWDTDKSYTRPQTIKHTCTSAQSKGVEFKWTDISTGDVSTYEGFTFTGFKVSTDFHGYVGKYLEGKLTTNASDLQVAMEDGAEFSVSLLNFATSKETEIQVIYGMSDGTTCKNTASSGPNMTDIANQQCGGAISMGFQVPESEGDGDITLAFYSIDFYCPQLTSGSNSKRGLSARDKIGAEAPLDATVFSTNEVTITSCGPEKPDCPASSTAVPSTESVGAGMPSSAAAESSAPWTPGAPSTESVSVGVPSSAAPESSVAPSTPVTPVETSSSAFTPSEVASPPVDSTVFSTNEVTITSCGPEVPDCPASSTALPSSTEAVSAGIPSSAAAESSIAPSTPVTPVHAETSSNSVFASSWSTSASPSHLDATVFSTNEVTVTSCGPEVTDCPASSTSLGVGFLSSFTPPAESSVPGGWGSSVSPVETTLSSFESSWVISSSAAVTSSAVIASTSTSIELGSWSWSASASASASASVETSSSIAVSSIGSVVPSDSTLTETVSGFVPAGSMGASSVPVASTPVSSTPVRPTKSTVYSSAAPLTSTRPAIPSRSSSIPVISSSRAVIPTPESSSAIPSVTPTEEGTTTLVTYETVTTCPITSTHYSGGSAVTSVYSTLSTLTLTSTSTVCTACKSGSAAAASSVMPTPTSTSVISSVPVSVPASSLSASSTPILSSWGMSSHASSDHVSTTEGTTTLVTLSGEQCGYSF